MKTDYLSQCNDQGLSEKDFKTLFCRRCRNQSCNLSRWGESRWKSRMDTQVEHLLERPLFADPNDSNFESLRRIEFESLLHKAEALIVSDLKGDWDVPAYFKTEQVHLAEVAPQETKEGSLSKVEEALRAMRNKGSNIIDKKPEPIPPPSIGEEEIKEELNGEPEREEPPIAVAPAPVPAPMPAPMPAPAQASKRKGLMIGGGQEPPPPQNDWGVPQEKVVKVGAKIKFS